MSVAIAAPDRPWIFGIRPRNVIGAEWQAIVQSILQRVFRTAPTGARTAEAEAALGLGSCIYFYVFQTSARFGSVVFLWRENPSRPWSSGDGAAAPFDTGGIWHDRVVTDPPLAKAERKSFVQTHSRPIDRWLTEFVSWIDTNYDETADYLANRPPRVGVPGIVYDSRNADGGWTWEARVRKASWNEQISIRHVFWSREDRTDFETWLIHRSTLDAKAAEDLIDLIQTVTIETPRHEQASVEVARYLMRIAAND